VKILPPTTIFNRRKINESERVSHEKGSEPNELQTVRNRERFNNLHQFVVCMRFPTVDSCLERPRGAFEPCFFNFWAVWTN